MHIVHVAIWVSDLEKEKEFYTRYFDCTAGEIYSNPGKHFTSCFISFRDGPAIELMKRDDILISQKGDHPGYAHIALNVGSREAVDLLTERLGKDGFSIKDGPRLTGDGFYESVVLDPEENLIELTC
jgi:lactoylglutathione lyase